MAKGQVCEIRDIDTALRIFWTHTELTSAHIRELFRGNISTSTVTKYKEMVRNEQRERGIKTCMYNTVNTRVAFEVWGIDVDDLEKRRAKLIKLGMYCSGQQ